MKTIGVLYAPFQTASVPSAHGKLLGDMLNNFNTIVVALPVRRVTPTKNAPLDYAARENMIREYFKTNDRHIYVVPVVDKKYPTDQVTALEIAVKALFSEQPTIYMSTWVEFAKMYKENGGKWTINKTHDFLGAEEFSRQESLDKLRLSTEEFRTGVIFGLRNQFPISWPTIDMAIRREVVVNREAPPHEEVQYLFGKKPEEKNWRFAGGFKDRDDMTFEDAVYREGGEELLKEGVNPKDVFDYPQYICSRNVNDWRYRGETDGITTLFYQLNFHGTADQIKAGDDMCDTAWLTLPEVHKQGIEGEHIYLLDSLDEFEATNAKRR